MASAVCVWNPGFDMGDHATHPSGAFTFTWTGLPACAATTGFTLDHYQVVLNESGFPSGPEDGTWVFAGSSPLDGFIHRSQRAAYGRLFACDDAGCEDVWGDDANEGFWPDDTATDTGATAREVWVVTGVEGSEDSTHYVVQEGLATAPSAFFYPPGWSRAHQVALYYSAETSVYMLYTDYEDRGWQAFNDPDLWNAVGDPVAGSHTSDADYGAVSHPYVLPVLDGVTERVWMLAQNQPAGAGDHHVVGVLSTDEDGDDFDLACAACCADGADGDTGPDAGECDWPGSSTAEVEVCVDATPGSSACDNLTSALHGRFMWDYVVLGIPDLDEDESLRILFSGRPDNQDCRVLGDENKGDIFHALWDPVVGIWNVDVHAEEDTGDTGVGPWYDCPTDVAPDHHDPAVTPLPFGEFKMYVVDWASHQVDIFYLGAEGWEDGLTSPAIYFDDSPDSDPTNGTVVDQHCTNNLDTLAYMDQGTPREGMFFQGVMDDTWNGEEFFCDPGFAAYGIYFAELVN